jgi:hypothetical protein
MGRRRCIAGDWRVSVASVWETLVEQDLRFKRALLAAIKAGDERAEHWPLGVVRDRRAKTGQVRPHDSPNSDSSG